VKLGSINKFMRVAIDISQVIYGTGVSAYTENLVKNLLKIDSENEYILFGGSLRRRKEILKIFPQAKAFFYPPTLADFVWNRLHFFPVEKLIGEIDVLHTSDWTEPPSKAFKVTTVHDLIPIKFPGIIHPDIVSVFKRRLLLVKKESDRIIVPSNSTKNDLISFGVDENKIRVIFEAPEAIIFSKVGEGKIKEVKEKYNIGGDYLIAFGSAPYKNTRNIIRAFELSSAGKNLKMVIIGRQSWGKISQSRNVRLTGFVSNAELSALFTGAKGLVFPSLYEGFGQPILEAFAYGIPVVTSNISSMPEVAGNAAVLVDPNDPFSISQGIESILRGPKGFVEKGLMRVKDFSWKKTAEETLNVYKEYKE
jgi:glycosyltransferase involved in cell wall biosynthesis